MDAAEVLPIAPRIRSARMPLPLLLAGLLVGAAVLLPAAYLLIRVAEGGAAAWDALTSSSTLRALAATLGLAVAVTAGSVAIGLPAAWLTARTDLPFRRTWSVLLALPLAVPSYVGAFSLVAFFGPGGILQDLLSAETLPGPFGFWGAWLALTLFTFPYVLLPVRATLLRTDRSLEDAARGLGAGPGEIFRRVTLPLLRPAIAAGGLLVALYALSDFGAVSILRFDSLTRVVVLQYQTAFDRTAAAATGLLLVVVAVGALVLEQATRGRARYRGSGTARPHTPVRLGRWRWPALAFCGAVLLAALGVPAVVMVSWLIRDLAGAGSSLEALPGAVTRSVLASGLAAVVAVAASLPVASLAVHHRGRLGTVLERLAFAGYGLPGVSVALALVFFAANYVPAVYQTLTLLVFAYVVRFLPQSLGGSRSALLHVHPHTEEVARSLGRGRLASFSLVTLPQMAPGVAAGGLLVWLTAMKELPLTLLLAPAGFDTLATQIWSSTTAGFFAPAAAPALLLVLVAGVPLVALALRGGRTEP